MIASIGKWIIFYLLLIPNNVVCQVDSLVLTGQLVKVEVSAQRRWRPYFVSTGFMQTENGVEQISFFSTHRTTNYIRLGFDPNCLCVGDSYRLNLKLWHPQIAQVIGGQSVRIDSLVSVFFQIDNTGNAQLKKRPEKKFYLGDPYDPIFVLLKGKIYWVLSIDPPKQYSHDVIRSVGGLKVAICPCRD